MLKRIFNPLLVYRVVVYLRMSSDQQNPRSPDQQLEEINRRLKANGYNWTTVKVYRDEGVSGRLIRGRKDFQQMLRDIKSGAVVVDLILVDTIERFGRVEELPTIRKQLFERHGVLVLTADSNFADPNTPQGKALGMVEAMRATEDGRIKAHNVLRGKRDAAQQKHWPGGPPPFGYMLKSILALVNGREEVAHRVIIPDPATRWIIELLFETAERESWGTTRLAKFLNRHPDIPSIFKPFHASAIGYWLDNKIYCGELVWAQNATGIVDDTRVVERNAEEDIIHVPDFCEPLVPRARWEIVQALRQVRRERQALARRRKAENNGKQIAPLAPGLALTYLLSGLLFCGVCGLRLTASSSGAYTAKDGSQRRYAAYICPGSLSGHCTNTTRVPEEWIRQVVIGKLRARLFPSPE